MTLENKEQECKKCGRVFGSVRCFDVDCSNNIQKLTMNQENKELLLKDLSSRFPYEVKIHAKYFDTDTNTEVEKVGVLSMIDNDTVVAFTCDDTNCYNYVTIHEVKPYLFPLSSMTEEQKKYINDRWGINEDFDFEIDPNWGKYFVDLCDVVDYINWLNENHFDYRGLINKGLAIDVTNLNIY